MISPGDLSLHKATQEGMPKRARDNKTSWNAREGGMGREERIEESGRENVTASR